MKQICRYLLVATSPMWAQISPQINDFPSREFGQPQLLQQLSSGSPNLVEGREFNTPVSIAFDTSASPPILYVADTFNHRVLAWRNPAGLGVCGTSRPSCGFADKVIGQRDFSSTLVNALTAGLSFPTAVAVDGQGNLYVADSGNNRILRFPAPFNQTDALLAVDLVIGQKSLTSGNSPNEGGTPSAKTLAFSGRLGPVELAFDSGGNLWVPDIGNNRVLRFPASSLSPNNQEPAADLVLGQFDFSTVQVQQPPAGSNIATQLYDQSLANPTGITFDQNGRLYVSDAYARVLQFIGPFTTGAKARRILGVNLQQTQPGEISPPYPNQYTLGAVNGNQLVGSPQGLFTLGNNLFVADSNAHRVVKYDVPENWPLPTARQPSPPILAVIGQPDTQSGKANKGLREPDASGLGLPTNGAFLGTDLWVVDTGNHRVLAFPPQGGAYTSASRLLGQLDFPFNTLNLIEGREVFFFANGTGAAGMVVDTTSNPPHLYVADSQNNRILGFNDARTVQQGSRADIVIGQSDLFRSLVNSPASDPTVLNDTGLFSPSGLVVDANHNLYVADTGNGRVLRFPSPFSQPSGFPQRANLVLGQRDFISAIKDPSPQNMRAPFGLALFQSGALAVSDVVHNRVLIFKPSGGDFRSGQAASIVLGQPDFNSTIARSSGSTSGMNAPRHIATDSGDRLYVADSQNGRVMIYTNTTNATNGAPSAFQITGLSTPQGVFISQITGEIWVANTAANQVVRFPPYETLVLNPSQVNATLSVFTPLAVTLDGTDNLIVGEGANRVTFFFPKMFFRNAANFNTQPLAPGMLAVLGQLGKNFSFNPADTPPPPWPTTMSDLQILVNGTPAPIFRVDSSAIYFQVPMAAPSSGTADFQIVRPSTGQIVAAASFPMAPSNPGFFTASQNGLGQVAARNDDQVTANSPTSPIGRGKIISFYLTGQGFVPNAPPDGTAPTGPVPTPVLPRVIINNVLAESDIQYSGLGGFPGGWQINARVPESVPPGNNVLVVVQMGDIPSNIGGSSNPDGSPGGDRRPIITTISVK